MSRGREGALPQRRVRRGPAALRAVRPSDISPPRQPRDACRRGRALAHRGKEIAALGRAQRVRRDPAGRRRVRRSPRRDNRGGRAGRERDDGLASDPGAAPRRRPKRYGSVARRDVPGFLQQYGQAGLAGELVGITPEAIGLPNVDAAGLSGVWPVMWHHTLEKYSARDLNSRYRRRFGQRARWSELVRVGRDQAGRRGHGACGDDTSGAPRVPRERPTLRRPQGPAAHVPGGGPPTPSADVLGAGQESGPGESGASGVEVIAEVPRGDLDTIVLPPRDGGCRIA